MEYIRGKFKQMIFESDNGYKVGLFRIKETNQDEMADFVNKIITFTGYFAGKTPVTFKSSVDGNVIFTGNIYNGEEVIKELKSILQS